MDKKKDIYVLADEQRALTKLRLLNQEVVIKIKELESEEAWFKHRANIGEDKKDTAIKLLNDLCKLLEKEYNREQIVREDSINLKYKNIFN